MKFLLLITISLLLVHGGHAMIETLSLIDLCHGSDVIISGEVIGVKSVGKIEDNVEVVANLIKVNEPLKGGLAVGDEVKIKTWRGIEDNAILTKGQKVILYLQKQDNYYIIFNGLQGWWQINEDGTFAGMGHGTTMQQIKQAIDSPPPASSTFEPLSF